MPTENRRVATYLPAELDDRLKAFITERNLKGDSAALIAILSEYFGVSQKVARKVDYSEFVRIEQFQELEAKVAKLSDLIEKSDSISDSQSRFPDQASHTSGQVKPFIKDEPTHTLPVGVPGQMDLLELERGELLVNESELKAKATSELLDESINGLQPLTRDLLAERFKLKNPKSLGNRRAKTRSHPHEFLSWSEEKDPDGIAWQYKPEDKLYYPIIDSLPGS